LDSDADPEPAPPTVTFLAPLDPLMWDRRLLRELWGFDYLWEVYVPEHKRRWGYYVLPMLFGDRFVGRIEPRFDRRARVLTVIGLWWEDGFRPRRERGFVSALRSALKAYARFVGAQRIEYSGSASEV
ncbi:MAG TPA: crosslink repair DNA glycosylase YcaQ family protein, partial [Candidatus Limnocylindrales bacterium]